MDSHAIEYYSPYSNPESVGHFHQVISLHENTHFDWMEVKNMVPKMCKGWYELARLPIKDRIEFIRDFWLSKLPYLPHINDFLTKFFSSLDDIGVFITQQKYEDPFNAHLVYSLSNNNGFFHGSIPASESEIVAMQKEFQNIIFPTDYLSFLQIHNSFSKQTDTGLFASYHMKSRYLEFQKLIEKESMSTIKGEIVNPASLIPFYESYGMPVFQCFWSDWYPDLEMGNVYFSSESKKISICENIEECAETLSFQNFVDWLMFYMEKID